MAMQLERFISDFLKEHPEHPDKGFLETKKAEAEEYLLTRDPQIGIQAVDKARRKIQDLVDRNIERRGPLTGSIVSEHESLKRYKNDQHGDDYVGNLLPTNCREYAGISNSLLRGHITTKDNLIELFDVRRVRNIGPLRAELIVAMRDLAIAEKSQTAQKQ